MNVILDNSAIPQESLGNVVAVSSSTAHACFLSGGRPARESLQQPANGRHFPWGMLRPLPHHTIHHSAGHLRISEVFLSMDLKTNHIKKLNAEFNTYTYIKFILLCAGASFMRAYLVLSCF